jgi:OmpA-OmpF porin, OOP family
MNQFSWLRLPLVAVCLMSFNIFATAQTKVEGLIQARSGDTMTLKTSGAQEIVILLTDRTDVGQVQGLLKARKKEMSMAALPGLAVKVEGSYNGQDELVAKSVRFKGNDLQRAEAIEAGMHETKAQVQQSKEELEKQNAALQQQQAKLAEHQAQLTEHQAKLAENKAAIDAAVARFGQLDDYYIFDEVTVYFETARLR